MTEATLGRVSELLQLSEEAAEEALGEACSDGMLWLRMDRVKRTVVFKEPKEAEATLTEWTEDVKGVMNGLDRIVYLIEKERMMKEVGLLCVCCSPLSCHARWLHSPFTHDLKGTIRFHVMLEGGGVRKHNLGLFHNKVHREGHVWVRV